MSKIYYKDKTATNKYEITIKEINESIVFNAKEINSNIIYEGSMNLTTLKEKHVLFGIYNSCKELVPKIYKWFNNNQIIIIEEENNIKLIIKFNIDDQEISIPINLPKIKISTSNQIKEINNNLKDIKSFILNDNTNNNAKSIIEQSKIAIINSFKKELHSQNLEFENKINKIKVDIINEIKKEISTPISKIIDKIESIQKQNKTQNVIFENNMMELINEIKKETKKEIINDIKSEIKKEIKSEIENIKKNNLENINKNIKKINLENIDKNIPVNENNNNQIKDAVPNANNQKIPLKKNPVNLIPFKDIAVNAWCDNLSTFDVYTNINKNIILVYFNNEKPYEIIFYDLVNLKPYYTINNAFNDKITSIRYYNDDNKRNLIVASALDKQIKIYDTSNKFQNFLTIKHQYGNKLNSSFIIKDNNKLYIIVADKENKIFIYDFNGRLLGSFGDNSKGTNYADVYYENKTTYIIQANNINGINSFTFNDKKLYYLYFNVSFQGCTNYCVTHINNITVIIASVWYNQMIRLFNFHTGIAIKEIKNESGGLLYCCCLWDNEYLFVGCNNKKVNLINIKTGKYVKGFTGHIAPVGGTMKKITHPVLNECLLTHSSDRVIKLWI